jgi:hypothetical protein
MTVEVVGSRPGARPEVPADISAVGGMGESEGPSLDRPFAGQLVDALQTLGESPSLADNGRDSYVVRFGRIWLK